LEPWARRLRVCEWAWKKVPEREGPRKKMRLAWGQGKYRVRGGLVGRTFIIVACG
jgi:hypothetical protein